jgi:hypothetical protein
MCVDIKEAGLVGVVGIFTDYVAAQDLYIWQSLARHKLISQFMFHCADCLNCRNWSEEAKVDC